MCDDKYIIVNEDEKISKDSAEEFEFIDMTTVVF